MNRSERALRAAPDVAVVEQLPRVVHRGLLFREHEVRDGPDRGFWWFSSTSAGDGPAGRFDLSEPRGTCYATETAGAAARERIGRTLARGHIIPATIAEGRAVSSASGELTDLGDLTAPDASAIGVTGEIHTIDDYAVTTSWADRADHAGMSGLRCYPRFTPGREHAFAVFGQAGPPGERLPTPERTVALEDVLYEVGLPVRGIPRLTADDTLDVDS